jgi:hypothetical protein
MVVAPLWHVSLPGKLPPGAPPSQADVDLIYIPALLTRRRAVLGRSTLSQHPATLALVDIEVLHKVLPAFAFEGAANHAVTWTRVH